VREVNADWSLKVLGDGMASEPQPVAASDYVLFRIMITAAELVPRPGGLGQAHVSFGLITQVEDGDWAIPSCILAEGTLLAHGN
jgi:hypothetical protein